MYCKWLTCDRSHDQNYNLALCERCDYFKNSRSQIFRTTPPRPSLPFSICRNVFDVLLAVERSRHRASLKCTNAWFSGFPCRSVSDFLTNCPVPSVHLTAKFPNASTRVRGSAQRNAGIQWLRTNQRNFNASRAIVYFADDDNTYDPRLFPEVSQDVFVRNLY